MISVFPLFSFSLFSNIQRSISLMQSSIADLHVDKSSGNDLSKKNVNVYHQHKSDKTDREILLYHLRGRCAMNTLPVYHSFFKFTICFQAETFRRSKVNSKKVGEVIAVTEEVLSERTTSTNVSYIRECLETYGIGW